MKGLISFIAAALLFAGVLAAAPQQETPEKEPARTEAPPKKTDDVEKSGDKEPEQPTVRAGDEDELLFPLDEDLDSAIEDDFEARIAEHLNRLFNRLFEEDFKPFQFRFFDEDPMNMDKVLEEFRRKTGQLDIELGKSATHYMFQRKDGEATAQFTLKVDSEGAVEAVVTRTDSKGNVEKKTYTAPSLEEFKDKYPEVAEEFRLDGFRLSFRLPSRLPSMLGQRHQGLGLRLDRAPFGFARKFNRKVLGVYTQAASAPLRAQLGLEVNEGLVVSETAEKTFAAEIGIRPMDVIVSVNGKKIGAADHIRIALSPVKEGDLVTVEVIRKGQRESLQGNYFIKK